MSSSSGGGSSGRQQQGQGSGGGLPPHPAARGAPNIFQRLQLGKPKSSRRSSSSASSSSLSASASNGGAAQQQQQQSSSTAGQNGGETPRRGPWQGIGSDDQPLPPLPAPAPAPVSSMLTTTTSSFVSTASSTTSGLSMGGSVALPGHLKMKSRTGATPSLQLQHSGSSLGASASGLDGDPAPSRPRPPHQAVPGGTVSRLLQHTQSQQQQAQQLLHLQLQSPRDTTGARALAADGAGQQEPQQQQRPMSMSASASAASPVSGKKEMKSGSGSGSGQQLAESVLNIDLTAADDDAAESGAASPPSSGSGGGGRRRRRGIGELVMGQFNQVVGSGSGKSPSHKAGGGGRHHGHGHKQQQQQQQQLSYTERKFEELMGAEVVDLAKLRELSWGGIPDKHRGTVWRLLLGYLPANRDRREATLQRKRREYAEILPQYFHIPPEERTLQEQEILRQILVDLPRTQPDMPLFHQEEIQRCMERVLYVWAIRHPASGYVQGMNDLITPLILVFLAERLLVLPPASPTRTGAGGGRGTGEAQTLDASKVPAEVLGEIEADVYWCITKLLDNIQDHYTFSQPGLQRMIFRLQALIERHDPMLHRHLEEEGLQYVQFAFRWMNCLLMRELSLDAVIRVWDTELAEEAGGFEAFHVYLCAAFLLRFADRLRTLPFQELVLFLQDLPTHDWTLLEVEPLLSQAHVLRSLYPDFGATSSARQLGRGPR